MRYNYDKLRGRIREKRMSETGLARAIGLSASALSLKLNGKIAFTQTDIGACMDVLDIGKGDVADYFFCESTNKMLVNDG